MIKIAFSEDTMTLSFDDIKSITRGAVDIVECDGLFRFDRFSDEQKAVYKDGRQRSYARTGATASVVLDFHTDSETLRFDYEIDRLNMVSPDFLFFDVWENDLLTHHVGEYKKEKLIAAANIKLKPGEKRVRIFFPTLFAMSISAPILDDGASFRPSERKRRALILGDSITQGFDAHFPSLSYANTLIRDFDLDAVNQAIGGEVFLPDALGTEPLFDADIVTVAFGTNDWSSGGLDYGISEDYFNRVAELYPRAKKIYISPIWRTAAEELRDGISFYEAIAEFKCRAKNSGFTVISGLKILPNMPQMLTDGLHPSDFGFTQYAKSLSRKLIENDIFLN